MAHSETSGAGARLADAAPRVALAALGLAVGLAPITNNDIWMHLATGRWMLENHRVPAGEVFSFVAAGRPYVAHEWGAELVLYALHALAGNAGLIAFKVLVGVALALAVHALARRRGASPAIACGAAALALFVAGSQLWERPHLFSWLLSLACVAVLDAARRRPRLLLLLPLLHVLWVNLHGGWVLGPLLVFGWAAGEWLRERRGAPDARPGRILLHGVASCAALLVNPYGLTLLLLPFELTGSEIFMRAVVEWQSPFQQPFAGNNLFVLLGFLLLAGVAALGSLRRWREGDPCAAVILLGMLALACRMNRAVPQFALLAASVGTPRGAARLPPLAAALSRRRAATLAAAGVLAAAGLILAAGYPHSPGLFRPRGVGLGPAVPRRTCDYLEREAIEGDAFTTYGEGAYVVWRLWPRVRVGMDSRNSVYGEDLYREYRRALVDDAQLAAWLSRHPVDLAVVGHDGPFRRGLDRDTERDADLPHRGLLAAGLELVDFDDTSAVYLAPTPRNMPRIERDSYAVIHPVLLPAVFDAGDLPQAIGEAERAVARHPDVVIARWILANAYAMARRPEQGLEQLREIVAIGPGPIFGWGVGRRFDVARLALQGLLEAQSGRPEAARDALREALRLDPRNSAARSLLERLGD